MAAKRPPLPPSRREVLVSTRWPGYELDSARLLPLEIINPNVRQARQVFDTQALKELETSIREHGVLEPILVRPTEPAGHYQIVAGERRYRAATAAGLTEIPAIIREDLTAIDAALITALENLQRQDLDIEDEARQFQYLLELTRLSQRALAEKLGIGYNYLSRRVRLLEHPELLTAVRAGQLSLNHALARLSEERRPPTADEVWRERSELEAAVSQGHTAAAPDAAGARDPAPAPPAGSTGRPAAAVQPTALRWRYVEDAYRPLKRIQPTAVPPAERDAWAHELRELAAYVTQLAQAIEAED